jgi:hypothetical protein
VVQNRLNQVAVVRLEEELTSGAVVNTLTSTQFDVPTTIDKFGRHLYAVNARFGNPAPAEAEYWVTRLSKE